MNRLLREGFTTGTAAAAAAKAAVSLLFGNTCPAHVSVPLPPFERREAIFEWAGHARLDVPISGGVYGTESGKMSFSSNHLSENLPVQPPVFHEQSSLGDTPQEEQQLLPEKDISTSQSGNVHISGIERGRRASDWLAQCFPQAASAVVIKDGGDDPDATHGMALVAAASYFPFLPAHTLENEIPGTGWRPLLITGFPCPVFLYAGKGIGRVTLPGLPVPPGEPAINPQPRRQIAAAVCEEALHHGYTGALHILIEAPEGEERALRTLNARLGILGGISILGTRGIVRPYSHESWKAAIEQGMAVAEASGSKTLLLSTGRRSEKVLLALHPGVPDTACVQAADFAAFSLQKAAMRSFTSLAWGCFPGKLLKLAQGLEWTHAKTAPAEIPLLAALWLEHGGDVETAEEIKNMPTAVGAFECMKGVSVSLRDSVLVSLSEMAGKHMRLWTLRGRAQRSEDYLPLKLCLYVFDLEGALLLTHTVLSHDEEQGNDKDTHVAT